MVDHRRGVGLCSARNAPPAHTLAAGPGPRGSIADAPGRRPRLKRPHPQPAAAAAGPAAPRPQQRTRPHPTGGAAAGGPAVAHAAGRAGGRGPGGRAAAARRAAPAVRGNGGAQRHAAAAGRGGRRGRAAAGRGCCQLPATLAPPVRLGADPGALHSPAPLASPPSPIEPCRRCGCKASCAAHTNRRCSSRQRRRGSRLWTRPPALRRFRRWRARRSPAPSLQTP